MNCRHARSDLALWVGRDLTDTHRREELRRHVSRCPECRTHYSRLKQTLRVLESTDEAPTYDAAESLWPELSSRIQQRAATRGRGPTSRFNGWLPFVAMTAACALLVVVMETRDAPRSSPMIDPIARDFLLPWSSGPQQPIRVDGPALRWERPAAPATLDERGGIVKPDPDSEMESAPEAPAGF